MNRTQAWQSAPLLLGFLGRRPIDPAGWRHVCVWCSWCATWHAHGDMKTGPGHVLHRASHCHVPDGPYQGHGYRIVVTTEPLANVYRLMKQATPKQLDAMQEGRTSPAIERLRAQTLPILVEPR
ncbi:hypothetical protein [Streptomyces sp. NPDC020996]|uniref:hypothetical protein n=1 Tax=Streptomyces sp. NPDC020996 TaxID=3154791 RepID=UPI0033F20143